MLNLAPMRGVRSLVFLGALRVGLQGLCSAATKIVVPRSKMQIAHSRSSGPGGQNVNKVNTKVELRFHVQTAEWLPAEVKARLVDDNANRVNKEGELIVTASESRSQASNMELAMAKIQEMVDLACIPPKVCRRGPAGRPPPGFFRPAFLRSRAGTILTLQPLPSALPPPHLPFRPRSFLAAWQLREVRTGLTAVTKRRRVEDKRRTAKVKEGRSRVDY